MISCKRVLKGGDPLKQLQTTTLKVVKNELGKLQNVNPRLASIVQSVHTASKETQFDCAFNSSFS